jgi:Mce-associated membrane protein
VTGTRDESPARPGGDPTSIVQRPAAAQEAERDSVDNSAGREATGEPSVTIGEASAETVGEASTTTEEASAETTGEASAETVGEASAAIGGSRRFPAVVVIALVLAGAVLQGLAWRARHSGTDRALVDAETTAVVVGDVSNGLSKVFSYAPDSTATTEQAAADVLGGQAASQYRTLFAQVKQRAAAEGLTVTTHVVRAGVTRLTGGTAQLLVFLDQDIVRKDKPNGTAVAAQLSVTARLDAGHWRIVDIHAR